MDVRTPADSSMLRSDDCFFIMESKRPNIKSWRDHLQFRFWRLDWHCRWFAFRNHRRERTCPVRTVHNPNFAHFEIDRSSWSYSLTVRKLYLIFIIFCYWNKKNNNNKRMFEIWLSMIINKNKLSTDIRERIDVV